MAPGQTVGLVGESGCGKSVTSLAIMRLLPKRGSTITGSVNFEGTDLLSLPLNDMRDRRGRDLAMIFQDPLSSLNPVVPIGIQVTEVLERHRGMKRSAAMHEARDLLDAVGIPDPTRRLKEYPHQLSGGMRQRALIAMALACRPRLMIADEPTTALDVTIQAQILALLKTLVVEHGTALIMITHDLGVVAGLVRRGERALRRPGGGAGRSSRAVRHPPAPVHARPAGIDPAAGCSARRAADAHHGFGVGQHPVDQRLRLRAEVQPGDRCLPGGHPGAGAAGRTAGAPAALPQPGGSRCGIEPLVREGTAMSGPVWGENEAISQSPDAISAEVARSAVETDAVAGADHHVSEPIPDTPAAELSSITADADVLLEVNDLKVHFPIKRGVLIDKTVGYVYAVDGVSLAIRRGETYGLVGESGCGKSTLGRGILRLVEPTGGSVIFDGENIAALKAEPLRKARRRMQMVFQDPLSSLDPRQSVQSILVEGMKAHGLADSDTETNARLRELLSAVGLPNTALRKYPHEFSGGQRQRIGIARALTVNPELIVADEPVSALDVSVQAQVINLLEDLQADLGLTYLIIAHDLAVVRHISDRVGVMYLGALVEEATSEALYAEPLHPYSRALLSAVPVPDPIVEDQRERILLTGDLPSPANPPNGCRFHTRCPWRQPTRCDTDRPELIELRPGHRVACHYATEIASGALKPHAVSVDLDFTPGPFGNRQVAQKPLDFIQPPDGGFDVSGN